MTTIDSLHIYGFKGIQEVNAETGDLNIITGRNNVGKTSLLEAIDLRFNPETLTNFGENVDMVINAEADHSEIDLDISRAQRTIDEFTDSNSDNSEGRMKIRHAREVEILDIFSKAVQDMIELNQEYPTRISSFQDLEVFQQEDIEIYRLCDEALNEAIARVPEEQIISELTGDAVILEVGGQQYPYVYLGQSYGYLRGEIIEAAVEEVTELLTSAVMGFWEKLDYKQERFIENLRTAFRDSLVPRFGSGRFVEGTPPGIPGCKKVDDVTESIEGVDLSRQNAAIRVSKIERYLKSNNLVDDLQDFSLEKLVFEGEEGAYEIPFSMMGDGFQTTVGLLWELFDQENEGEVLLLEEPENHLHPGYIEHLAELLARISKQHNLQIFLTTHNIDFIQAFFSPHVKADHENFLLNRFNLVQLQKNVARHFNYEQSEERIEDLDLDLRGV